MDWLSFILGLLAFPILISGLVVARLLVELAVIRRTRRLEKFHLTEDSVA